MRRWRDGRPRGGGGGRGAGQAAIARAGQGPEGWAPEERAVAEGTTTLAGGVDGGRVHHSADGPEMEVATLAPLGPERQAAPQSGRTHLAWGHASYGAGTEDFGWRVRVEARRRGAPWPCWATGPSGSGGAPGTAVVEIVDIVRAYGYLRDVATAVGGAGTAAASAWVEPPKDRLYQQGAAPVLAALAALSPPPPPSAGAHSGYTPSAAGPDPVRPAVPPRTRLSAAPQTDRPAAPAPFAPLGISDLCRGTPIARQDGTMRDVCGQGGRPAHPLSKAAYVSQAPGAVRIQDLRGAYRPGLRARCHRRCWAKRLRQV